MIVITISVIIIIILIVYVIMAKRNNSQHKELKLVDTRDLYTICLFSKEILIDIKRQNAYLEEITSHYLYSNQIRKFLTYEENPNTDFDIDEALDMTTRIISSMKYTLYMIEDIMQKYIKSEYIEQIHHMFKMLYNRSENIIDIMEEEKRRIAEKQLYTTKEMACFGLMNDFDNAVIDMVRFHEKAVDIFSNSLLKGDYEKYKKVMQVLKYEK